MRGVLFCLILVHIDYLTASPVYPRFTPTYSYQIEKLLKTLNVSSENLLHKIYHASASNNYTTKVNKFTIGNSHSSTEKPIPNNSYFKLIDLKLYTITTRSSSKSTATPHVTTTERTFLPTNYSSTASNTTLSNTSESEKLTVNEPLYIDDTEGTKTKIRKHGTRRNVQQARKEISNEKQTYKSGQDFKVKTPSITVRIKPKKDFDKTLSDNEINHDELECFVKQSSEPPSVREGFDDSFLKSDIPEEIERNNNGDETNSTDSGPLTDKSFYTMVTDALLLVASDMVHQKGPLSFQMKPGLEFTVGNLGYITRAGSIELDHPKNGRQKMIKSNIIVGPISIIRGKDVLKPENDFKFYLKGDIEIRIKRNVKREVVLHLTDLEIGSTNGQIILIKTVKRLATSKTYEMIQDFLFQMDLEGIVSRSLREALRMDSIHKTFIAIPEFLPL